MSELSSSDETSRLSRFLPDGRPVRERLRDAMPRLTARARLVRRRMSPSGDTSVAERLEAIDSDYVAEGARDVTGADVETVVEEADAIEDRFRNHGPLRRLLDDGRVLLALVRDTWGGRYPHAPWWTLSGAAFALLYVLNPFDLVPDALPIVGVLDDAAVVSACLVLLEQDLSDYRRWRQGEANPDAPGKSLES